MKGSESSKLPRPVEGSLFYQYERLTELKISPGHWKGICSSCMKGRELKASPSLWKKVCSTYRKSRRAQSFSRPQEKSLLFYLYERFRELKAWKPDNGDFEEGIEFINKNAACDSRKQQILWIMKFVKGFRHALSSLRFVRTKIVALFIMAITAATDTQSSREGDLQC